VFIWEISLTGKIKKVIHLEKRIKEAKKMGFKKIIIPHCDIKKISAKDIELIQIQSIDQLVAHV
jgi:DNA repair protein RadA/Sms